MSSKGNYLKWTGRLAEEFSTKGFELASTGHSFHKPFLNQTLSVQQNQNQMPQNYRRYADSIEAKRNNYSYSSNTNLHSYLSNLPFVEYSHNSQKNGCGEQHGLKKKSVVHDSKKGKGCHYCQDKKETRKQQKSIQNRPVIIKEVQRIFVPQPTIIRQIVRPPVVIHQPQFITNPPPQVHVFPARITRIQSQTRPASVGRVHFNYTSPNFRQIKVQPEIKHSVILTPNKRREGENTPYKLLDFSMKKPEQLNNESTLHKVEKVFQTPKIIVRSPIKSEVTFQKDQFRDNEEYDNFITSHFIGSAASKENSNSHIQQSPANSQRRKRIFKEQNHENFDKMN